MKWHEISIGDLGEVITGNTPLTTDREFYGGAYPFIKPTDMEIDRRYVTTWEENYSEKAFKKYKNAYIPPGSTGVVTIGTVGEKIFQANRYCFTNQSVNVVIPDKTKYNPDFVYYLLKYNLPKVSSANPGTASGRHHVSKSNFCSIKVSVPSDIAIQEKIGEILSAYDALIENNLKRIKLLEELAQRTYEEWFVKFRIKGKQLELNERTNLPGGWTDGTIGDLVNFQNGFAFKSSRFTKQGNPVIKIKNIDNNTVDIIDSDCVDDEYALEAHKFKLNQGDLLIAMTGATLGKVGFLPHSRLDCYLNQRVGRFVKKGDIDNTYFVFCALASDKGLHRVLNLAGGAAQPNISGSQILSIESVIPSDDILKSFSELLQSKISLSLTLRSQNYLLKEARDILLPRLMTGAIDLSGLEEELAVAAEPKSKYNI